MLSKEDNRIKVIHKPNGGVAKARNTGLQNARGDLIAWCDADDYVEPDWLKHQWETYNKYGADITVCHCFMEKDGININNNDFASDYECFDNKEAIEMYLNHRKMNGMLWNKLFRAELLEGLKVNESLSYCEDTEFLWEALKRTKQLVITPFVDYHYIVSGDHLSFVISENSITAPIRVCSHIVDDSKIIYPDFVEQASKLLVDSITASTNKLFSHGVTADLKETYYELKNTSRNLGLKYAKYSRGTKRITYCLLYFGIRIPKIVYRVKQL